MTRYLRDRKEAHQKEQKAKAEAFHSDCPEGHVSLLDHERKETLRLLKKSTYLVNKIFNFVVNVYSFLKVLHINYMSLMQIIKTMLTN